MSDVLNYPGDLTNIDTDWPLGPDMFGAYYLPVSATYDPAANRSAVHLRPVPPAELQQRAATQWEIAQHAIAIHHLFKGAAA